MTISSHTAALSLLAAIIFLPGCAAKAVSDSDRDTTRSFDGNWKVLGQRAPGVQYIDKWTFNCNSNPFEFNIRVTQGKAYFGGTGGSGTQVTNVGKSGKFTFIVPLDVQARESGSSGRAITGGKRRVEFKGNLSENSLKGSYRLGIQQFAWQGCTSKVKFEKST